MLQYVAVCCSVLQYVAACCSAMKCVAVWISPLLGIMCDATNSYVEVTHSYVGHDSFTYGDMTHLLCLVYVIICDATNLYVGHDSFIRGTYSTLYERHGSFICGDMTH